MTALNFDTAFAPDGACNTYLWANRGRADAIRFEIVGTLLTDVLDGGNPISDARNVETCERQRARIEAACVRAASRAVRGTVRLVPDDFC